MSIDADKQTNTKSKDAQTSNTEIASHNRQKRGASIVDIGFDTNQSITGGE